MVSFTGSTPAGSLSYDSGDGLSLNGAVQTFTVDAVQFSAAFGGACALSGASACRYTASAQDNGEPGVTPPRPRVRAPRHSRCHSDRITGTRDWHQSMSRLCPSSIAEITR